MACIVHRQIIKKNDESDFDDRNRSHSQQWDVGFIPLPTEHDLRDESELFDWSLSRSHTKKRVNVYLKQACPMALTGLLEDGQIQFIGVLAGRLGTIAAATHNGMFQVFWFLSSFMWAISAATRIRISTYLGGGDRIGAQFSMRVATSVALPSAAIVAVALVILRNDIGHVFSHDTNVLQLVSEIMLLVGCGYFALGIFYICMATLAAQGRPHLIAISFVIGAWFVCIPLAFYFRSSNLMITIMGNTIDMKGLFGLWASMSAGYGITSLLAGIFVCRTDWVQVTTDAVDRAEGSMYDDGGGSHFDDDLNSQGGGGINRSGKIIA
jgi:Na+-driven multidrug efflux pump